jgi:hypothetical protein
LSVILRVVYDEVFPKVVDVNIIGQMDIDLSYDPQFLPACTQFDVIIRSRYAEGAGLSNWPGYRTTLSLRGGGNTYVRMMIGLRAKDYTSTCR